MFVWVLGYALVCLLLVEGGGGGGRAGQEEVMGGLEGESLTS